MTKDRNQPIPVIPEWDSFYLTYTAWPSFQAEYGVRMEFKNGVFKLWTKNAPNMELMQETEEVLEGPGIPVPMAEALRVVDLLKRARITPFSTGVIGCDGVTYQLNLSHGHERIELGWWQDLPKGWRGLQPVVDFLESHFDSPNHGRE